MRMLVVVVMFVMSGCSSSDREVNPDAAAPPDATVDAGMPACAAIPCTWWYTVPDGDDVHRYCGGVDAPAAECVCGAGDTLFICR